MAKNHGPTVEDDKRYEALRKQGASRDQMVKALRNH